MTVKRVLNARLGVELSQLGFGAMRLPTLADGKIDWPAAAAMLDRAYAAGVNFFDTAYPYHGGESQIFLGESLAKYPRDSYHFATKLPIWLLDSKAKLAEIFEEQLRNCRMEYFDFYMIHALGEDRYDMVELYDVYNYLLAQKAAGRIKFLCFSYHGGYDCFARLFDNYAWDFAMIQHNYVDDALMGMGRFYDLMAAKDVPCIAMEPVRGRFLAEPPQAALDEMRAHGSEYSPAAWALRWCRALPNVCVTLSGMSTMEQVEENIRTFATAPEALTEAELAMLARARDIMLAIKTVPCTYCRYCMDCPDGVEIPGLFEVYNQFKLFPNEFRAGVNFGKLVRDGQANCSGCGKCSPLCPQKIDIAKELGVLAEELEPFRLKFAP